MADIRALLAAERQSRRISHPHLTYTKSGLICTLCNLNVKSEALWEGHLRSANHRKNAQPGHDNNTTTKGVKRKIEAVDELPEQYEEADTDARKKPKSRPENTTSQPQNQQRQADHGGKQAKLSDIDQPDEGVSAPTTDSNTEQEDRPTNGQTIQGDSAPNAVDEAEWAAFEAEVAPLAKATVQPDYQSHTIVAAPVTTAQVEAQAAEDGRKKLEIEAEAEKEDEERRLEDEFEVMEEMEERVRRLREKREALKNAVLAGHDTGQGGASTGAHSAAKGTTQQVPDFSENDEKQGQEEGDDEEGDAEDEDDWYA